MTLNETVLKALVAGRARLETQIGMTPTGDERNKLCDENIELFDLINEFEGVDEYAGKTAESVLESARKNNEPVFVLRAKDKASTRTLSRYVVLCQRYGCNLEFLQDVNRIAMDFYNWRTKNKDQIKIPD